jgi:hypothetical protein
MCSFLSSFLSITTVPEGPAVMELDLLLSLRENQNVHGVCRR